MSNGDRSFFAGAHCRWRCRASPLLPIVHIAFAVMPASAAPTLNLFAVGFPVIIVCGLAIVFLGLPGLQANFMPHCACATAFDLLRGLSSATV